MYKPLFLKREVIVFRQFQRKGYSLFACLGREVVISVLSVATLSAAKAPGISDEVWRVDSTGHTREVMLADVGVNGSRAPLATSQAARMVTVLSHDDIAQAPVQSVNDLLKYAVGIDVRQRGPLGAQTDVSIRGGTQEQIAILLNGINISDPQTGHNAIDIPCQLSDIVRIEVLEGPAGRIYGTSSLVGAINIVTAIHAPTNLPPKGEAKSAVGAQLEAGSFGYMKAAVTAAFTNHTRAFSLPLRGEVGGGCPLRGEVGGGLSASYARSDGYSRSRAGRLNTGYSGSKAFCQGSYRQGEALYVGWHIGVSDRGWGSGTFYATPRWQADEQYEHTTKWMAALQAHAQAGALHLQPAIYWQLNHDRYEGYRDRPDILPYNYNRCNVGGVKINAYFDSPIGRTALGAELRNEDHVSANLGEPLEEPRHIQGTDRHYTLGINRTNMAAHLEHNVLLRQFTLSAGFVAAKSSWSKMNITIYPGIDMSYNIPLHKAMAATTASLKLFAGWNTSLRLPTFTEMYYKLQGYDANPHLKPEEMQAIEGGAQLNAKRLQAKAALFHHRGRDMIDWIMDTTKGDDAVWSSVNHTRINATGMETDMRLRMPAPWQRKSDGDSWGGRATRDEVELHLSYTYIDQDKELEEGMVSQYAMEYLRHKLVATVQLPLGKRMGLRMGMRWQDRVGSYTTFEGETKSYRPYAIIDARLAWTARHCTLYAEVNNLLDNRSYTDFGNVKQPGAWIVAGITINN